MIVKAQKSELPQKARKNYRLVFGCRDKHPAQDSKEHVSTGLSLHPSEQYVHRQALWDRARHLRSRGAVDPAKVRVLAPAKPKGTHPKDKFYRNYDMSSNQREAQVNTADCLKLIERIAGMSDE